MPNVDIGAAVAESFRFVGTAWARAWGSLLILVWVTAAAQAVVGLRPEWIGFVWPLGAIFTGIASTAVVGALYRIGLESQHAGDPDFRANAAGLQWGSLEWRVLGSNLLIALMFGGLWLLVLLIWVIVFGIAAQGQAADLQAVGGGNSDASASAFLHLLGGPASLVSVAILVPAFCAYVYFAIRLSLFPLIAADTRAFSFGRSWSLTRGAVLAMFVASVVIYGGLVIGGVLIGVLGAIIAAAAQAGVSATQWIFVAGAALGAVFTTPLLIGLQLYVYNVRRPADAGIAATFA